MNLARKTDESRVLRKNFTMPDDTVKELEFLAKLLHKKQSQIVQELIHKESEIHRSALRLKQLEKLKGSFTGLVGDEQSIQAIKGERNL